MTHAHTPPDDVDSADALWAEAMEAVIRVKALPAGPEAERAARHWRARSPAHAAAWAEAERVWRVAGALPAAHAARWNRPSARPGRRAVLTGAGALAAGGAGLLLAPDLWHRLRGDAVTGTAELRDLDLPDGSRVTLGPGSVLRAVMTPGERGVELADGIAFFTVRPDPDRPFVVDAGPVRVRVLGTAFELRRGGARATVAVQHGAVRVQAAGAATPATLRAGEWLSADGEGAVARGAASLDRIAAWRDRMLVVDQRPIAEVAAELGRWHHGRILVLDEAFGRRPVSGVFDLDQPEAALRALVRPYGGRVRRVTGWLLLVDAG